VSFKIIMTASVTRPCFTTQHQTCKTKTVFLVWDRSCPKTKCLRSHHWWLGQKLYVVGGWRN